MTRGTIDREFGDLVIWGSSDLIWSFQAVPDHQITQSPDHQIQTSNSSASSARYMMKRNRADAYLPISSLMTRSVTIWSATSTRSSLRVFGVSVVSQRTFG